MVSITFEHTGWKERIYYLDADSHWRWIIYKGAIKFKAGTAHRTYEECKEELRAVLSQHWQALYT